MVGSTTWLAGKVASLVPNVLPSMNAAASSSSSVTCFNAFSQCVGTSCVPSVPQTQRRVWVVSCTDGRHIFPSNCCGLPG